MSVFEWLLVGPKGQGHVYVGAVVTNFLMTAFIKMSENAPSYLLWSLTRITLHFCVDIVHLLTATIKQRAVFWPTSDTTFSRVLAYKVGMAVLEKYLCDGNTYCGSNSFSSC